MKLKKTKFSALPPNRFKPTGWLQNQLRIQADGLSGHLDEFWPDIKDSQWFGGKAEGWERAPYWLDGVIPLAFLLDDKRLIEKVHSRIDYIISHQENGWLGPIPQDHATYDMWGQFLAVKMMMQYHESTGETGVIKVVENCLRRIHSHIDVGTLFNWGQFRWFEVLPAIYHLYDTSGEQWLLDLALKLRTQGFDWFTYFKNWPLRDPTPKYQWNYMGHVVNNAMAIKAYALWWLQSHDPEHRDFHHLMMNELDRYHGVVTGVFSGDECLAGRSPIQGTELCAVVEYMYSLQVLIGITGDPDLADRLEQITYNALPATFSPDMWSHQYDQQINQVECSINENRIWNTNGPDANIFGLEPNYGCCTANLSQGWPKFASHLWMNNDDGGLVAIAYAPGIVSTSIKGVDISVELETDYPFRNRLLFTVRPGTPVEFPLYLRIPDWAKEAKLSISGEPQSAPQPGSFHQIVRRWEGETKIALTLPMTPNLAEGSNHAVSITRGPLVYALKIGEDWRQIEDDKPHRELPHADWEVYPTTEWNYALDLGNAKDLDRIGLEEMALGQYPFSPEGAPIKAKVFGKKLPDWKLVDGSAGQTPLSPVSSGEPLEELTLIPYGCTNLRITEFPVLGKDDS